MKKLPAKQETWVQSLGWEDPLEAEMATHSNKESDTTERLNNHNHAVAKARNKHTGNKGRNKLEEKNMEEVSPDGL